MKKNCFTLFFLFLLITVSAQTLDWVKSIGSNSYYENATAIKVTNNGKVYLSGYFSSSSAFGNGINLTSYGDTDGFLAEYTTSGTCQWAIKIGGTSADKISDISIDNTGNIIVVGTFSGACNFGGTNLIMSGIGSNGFIAKYNATGSLIWVKQCSGTWVSVSGLATDTVSNANYITGTFEGPATFGTVSLTPVNYNDIYIIKFDANGNSIWGKQGNGIQDYGNDITCDKYGNVYATGYFSGATLSFNGTTVNNFGQSDIFIVKYNAAGTIQWLKNAGGSGFVDYGHGIYCDKNDNLYVTGKIEGAANFDGNIYNAVGQGMFIVCYDVNGTFKWLNGGQSGSGGKDIGADVNGNVYLYGTVFGSVNISGTTVNGSSDGDIFIAKYNSSGTLLSIFVDGGANQQGTNDGGKLPMHVQSDGTQYLAGQYYNSANFSQASLISAGTFDIYLAKYLPYIICLTPTVTISASNNPICTGNTTTLTASGASSYTWNPGNITGSYIIVSPLINTTYTVTANSGTCTNTNTLSLILQYPPNQPNAITGNASVSAGSSQTYSVTAVAGATSYSWILPLGWTGSSTTNTINLTAGTNNGTVSVVAQNSCGTSPSRTLAVTISTCTIPNQPNAITGNASVSAGSSQTYSIASVANATSYNWALPLGWSGNSTNNTINITTGPNSGTISVVAQNSCGVSPSSSITVSVSSATNTPINHDWVWAKSTNEQYASNYSKDIATDADGNTYITGTFYSSTIKFGSIVLNKISPSSWDIFIAKYDANGNALWAKNARVDSPLEECAIATDANNNVFLTGSYKSTINFGSFTLTNGGSSTTSSMFLVKFDSQGNTIWAKDADYSSTLWVSDLAIDSQGNAFITGSYSSPAFTLGSTTLPGYGNSNPFLVKYDSFGNVVWAKGAQQTTTNSFGATWSYGIAIDLLDNIYITGDYINYYSVTQSFSGITLPNTGNSRCMYLTKYNNSGNIIWIETSQSSIALSGYSGNDSGRNISVDSNNNVMVSGSFTSAGISFDGLTLTNAISTNPNSVNDVFLVKYDANGAALWAKKAGGISIDASTGITSDHLGNIYISGHFESKPVNFGSIVINKNSSSSPLIFVAKYNEFGNESWVKYVENTHGSFVESVGVSADNSGNVYVTGCTYDNAVFGNTTLIYGGIFVAKLGENQVGVSEINSLENKLVLYPNPSTGIIKIKSTISLKNANVKIFNTQSQTVFETNQFIDEIDLSNQPKGVYFLQIKGENKVINKKVIIQ